MGMHLYYLNRKLDSRVMKALVELIYSCDLNKVNTRDIRFINLIKICFGVKREDRPSVSQLSDIFRKYNCKKPGTLATQYAIRLESLAMQSMIKDFRV